MRRALPAVLLALAACHGGDERDGGIDASSADGGVDAPPLDLGVDTPAEDVGVDMPAEDLGVDMPAEDLGVDAGDAGPTDSGPDAATAGVTCRAWPLNTTTCTYSDPPFVETDVRIQWGGGPGTGSGDAVRVYSTLLTYVVPAGSPVIAYASTGVPGYYPVGFRGSAGGISRVGTVFTAAIDGYSPGPADPTCLLEDWHVVCDGSVDIGPPPSGYCTTGADCGPGGAYSCDAEGLCHAL